MTMMSSTTRTRGAGDNMASKMVKAATSDKLKEKHWAKNIEICKLVALDPGYACHPPPVFSLSEPLVTE
jgi:hypothetical protein